MYVFFALVVIIVVALAALAFAVLARTDARGASREGPRDSTDGDRA